MPYWDNIRAMNSVNTKRSYKSKLRETHKVKTRELILEELSELLAEEGLEGFSIRALSVHSGISMRTIYRYFASKTELLDSLAGWIEKQLDSPDKNKDPRNLEELSRRTIARFRGYDKNPELIKALIFSATGQAVRSRFVVTYKDLIENALKSNLSGLDTDTRKQVVALCYFLISADSWEHFRDFWKFDGNTSAKLSTWTLKLVTKAIEAGDLPE